MSEREAAANNPELLHIMKPRIRRETATQFLVAMLSCEKDFRAVTDLKSRVGHAIAHADELLKQLGEK